MRRFAAALASLMLCGVLSVLPSESSTLESPSTPQDPLLVYFNTIVLPAAKGQPPTDEALKSFYDGLLLPGTRVQVAEDQFITYWKNVANGNARPLGYTAAIDSSFSEPVYNDSSEEAVIISDLTVTVAQSPGFQLFGILVAIGCGFSGGCAPMVIGGRRITDTVTTYHIVKQGDKWSVGLPGDIVKEMQKLPTKVTAKRYAPNTSVTETGVTLRASEISLDRDITTVRLVVENATDNDVNLFNAALGSTLTDEQGKIYQTRVLRSSFPDHVSGKSSAEGDLAFDPVPPGISKLVLTVTDVPVGDKVLTMKLEITLRPQ